MVCQFGVMFLPDKAAGFAEARRVLKPGGRFVFSVWDRLDINDMSRVAHETVASLFPHDPPTFLARVPFGYHDEGHIRGALLEAGFGEIAIERVALAMPAGSALDAATGLCKGSPLSGEIEARYPEGLDIVVEAVARALARAFGERAIVSQGQALVVTAV